METRKKAAATVAGSSANQVTKSCSLCDNVDNNCMVQCDKCDGWFHFSCVAVTEEICNEDWVCGDCAEGDATIITACEDGDGSNGVCDSGNGVGDSNKGASNKEDEVCKAKDVERSKNKKVIAGRKLKIELLRLEEEKELQMRFLKKKYDLMLAESDSGSDSEAGVKGASAQRVEWAEDGKGLGFGKVDSRGSGEDMCDGTKRQAKNSSFPSTSTTCASRKLSTSLAPSVEQIYARQAISKELPVFSGKPDEWPLFLSSFENSTRLCGLSDDENLLRLQRALKGKALEYVSNRLTLPSLVPEVISTLRMVFGRPEHIINSLLAKIRCSPGVNSNKLDTLINFSLEVKNVVSTMEAANLRSHLNNPSLLQELLEKLPTQMRLDWSLFSRSIIDINLKDLSDWLFELAEAASRVISSPVASSTDNERRKAHRVSFHGNGSKGNKDATQTPKCHACGETHSITRCQVFKSLNYNERWNMVHNNKLCRSCLKFHDAFFCPERKECQVGGCHAKHHPLLHKPNPRESESPSTSVVAVHSMQTSKILYRILPITIFGKNSSVDVYAFLDDGSGPTLIEKDILSRLGVEGSKSDLCLRWTDGSVRVERNSHNLDLVVAPEGKIGNKFTLKGVRSVTKLDLPSQTLRMDELSDRFKHLRGLPVKSYGEVVPSVIIGLNNRSLAMPLSFREGRAHEPAATKTRLGWTIYGELDQEHAIQQQSLIQLHICECDDDAALQTLMIENMKIENQFQEDESLHKLDSAMIEKLQQNVKRDGDRFEATLLWKSNNISLPDNYGMAYRRLCCFERKLTRDLDLKSHVCSHIKDMDSKGYIRKLSTAEINVDYLRKWYLPIFAVRNPNKPSKIRVVWDAAAECNGVSLNGCLERGPDLMASLIDVLFNFRIGKIGICGDISEMFHRIAIKEVDQQCQRFLWRDGKDDCQPDVYVLKVMSFGASCSPSLAQTVKNLNALEYKHQFPRAAKSIIERHYVDDMLDSVNSVQEAIELAKQVREVHKHGNFHIRNWLSNSVEVIKALGDAGSMENFCKAGRTVEQVMEADKVLGMWWRTFDDTFTFDLKYTKASKEILKGDILPTKRQLLRLLMSIFDPLGLLAFFTVYMKILLQDIWRSGIEWDEVIPQEFVESWNRWRSVLKNVEDVHIPRCYFKLSLSDSGKIEVHVFVDASESAYAAVAYLRITSKNGVEVSLVCSRTKVAPLKPISIPRMELLAVVLGSRLGNIVVKAHDLKIETTHYWTDSKTVLAWLRSDPKKYKQFVMFRIGEVQETTEVSNWRYVPSKQNVADMATKWSRSPDFSRDSTWFTGPDFLLQQPDQWPSNQLSKEESSTSELKQDFEFQQVAVHITLQQVNIFINYRRFSKWERLYRCMAYVRKYIDCLKSRKFSKERLLINCNIGDVPNLTANELRWSHETLYRLVQAQAYCLEYRLLLENPIGALPRSSPLKTLSPFIDKNKIIRMRSRLENTNVVSDATKNPVILPRTHYVTKLIVDFYHRKLFHVNHETAINEIFQSYHILGLRSLLRTIRTECQICKIRRANPTPPEMAPLPDARLSPYTRAFSYVGLDFFGPYLVTIGRRSEKRYGTVFTCLTCRAVHIEVAHSLSMSSCIMVIRNFIARRGSPIHFYSDNGTNLRAAEKELRQAYQKINFNGLQAEFTSPETGWTFIPPGSPHMGGAWERMVRSIKTVLCQIITHDTKLTDEKLNNLLVEVESIINSRPLTYLSLDTAEEEALTPNHFLLGSSSGNKPPGSFESTDQYVRSSWRHSQFLADRFWKRWVAEYLPTLTRRTNWFEKAKPIEEGDTVVIVDSNLPRHCWPKGIVVRTIIAKDGQVRSAFVRTSSGEYHRPAAKIAVLDVKYPRESNDV